MTPQKNDDDDDDVDVHFCRGKCTAFFVVATSSSSSSTHSSIELTLYRNWRSDSLLQVQTTSVRSVGVRREDVFHCNRHVCRYYVRIRFYDALENHSKWIVSGMLAARFSAD